MQGRDLLITQRNLMGLLVVCFCRATEQGQNSGEKVNYSFNEVLKYQNVESIQGLY